MSRSSSGMVAGLTAAALAVVGFLAYQASANAPDTLGKPASPSAPPSHVAQGPQHPRKDPTELPGRSGDGARVVYALKAHRVWLVGADGTATRSFSVQPSTVSPAPGTYRVTHRTDATTGSDGVPIEHVVLFSKVGTVVVGFSAAQDGSTPAPDPAKKTGGVRTSRTDGDALWTFATLGSKVVVIA
ncbi:hypothetical protein [Streptomyces fuscigenes]|uniref:hypothetical protein n=1 Tax=Streptomyces fuscigenes TaxID=1528880 RepID=UPI001F46CCB5|nr:hypothetical protein [Streptomyces fuscigenes]MCF3964424.1 hypothetical protein [Streptomyces fuscigenes]